MSEDAGARPLIQGLVAEVLARKKKPVEPARIVEGVSFTRDLGIDSLDVLQIAAVLEKKLGLRFEDAEVKTFDDLGAVLAAVGRKRP